MKVWTLVLLALFSVFALPSNAQTCSATVTTNKLICALPQLFGPGGLTLPNPKHEAHFEGSSLQGFLAPLNTEIGLELSTLPLGSSGSGISFSFDKEHHPVSTEDTLGPILTERAAVIGKKKVDLGVAYQYFSFSQVDGLDLHKLNSVFQHAVNPGATRQKYENDYINTSSSVNIALNQTVFYAVFGVSKGLDVSAQVPIGSLHLRLASNANIVRTQPCENTQNQDPTAPNYRGGDCVGASFDPSNAAVCGEFHYFTTSASCSDIFNSTSKVFTGGGDVTGIGDVILRAKYELINHEKLAGSVGMSFRLPTGDVNKLLGSGAVGLEPFGALTYRSRWSPHVRLGYQWNGKTLLGSNGYSQIAIDPVTDLPEVATPVSKSSLPPELLYSAGFDLGVTKRLTVAADFIGARILSAPRLVSSVYPDFFGNSVPNTTSLTADYSSDSIAVGGKIRLYRELVLIANATIRVDDGGLRANVVPLVGLSWSK
jgi:hypothetical protein